MSDSDKLAVRKFYYGIDLSNNTLSDDDVTHVTALAAIHRDNCKEEFVGSTRHEGFKINMVSLKNTRIGVVGDQGLNQALVSALKIMLSSARFVDVAQTPFASVNSREFFIGDDFAEAIWHDGRNGGLIFIPEVWLKNNGWHGMVPKALHDDVRFTHLAFYDMLATR